jgi:predicted glycoside hydrolase/deacetylase ChbG (UPF0249 family)
MMVRGVLFPGIFQSIFFNREFNSIEEDQVAESVSWVKVIIVPRVIINADDFGLTDGICRSISQLLAVGAISDTTLMACAEGAIARFKQWNASDLAEVAGVHLQLTAGMPLSSPKEVPSLIDPKTGAFRDPRVGPPVEAEEVEFEWRRQIDTVGEALGAAPNHLDSHHGVHRLPECCEAYLQLAAEFKIPVRGASGKFVELMTNWGVRGSAAIISDWTGRSQGIESLKTMIRQSFSEHPQESFLEVITHPGYPDHHLQRVSSLVAGRESDHHALLALGKQDWLTKENFSLSSFSDIRSIEKESYFPGGN